MLRGRRARQRRGRSPAAASPCGQHGAGAGLPQGKAFGLAVDGIDIAAGMITVSQQLIVVDRRPVLAPPKTSASVRDVCPCRRPCEAITSHISDLALVDRDVLCRTPRHTLLRRDYYNREIWKPALACAGLAADMAFHDLRHYLRQHCPCRGRPDLRGIALARAQVHHHHGGPLRSPGPGG